MSPTLTDWQTAINHALDEQLATVANPHLRAAMAYSVDAGGKRLRPLLLLSIVAMYDGVVAEALPAATALEFVHTYSLIHDDLPAMDNDDLRRGQPTNHKQFGEALAILAGDALLTDAFAILSRHYPEKGAALVQILAEAAGSSG
ncbi:MAG: polyprenyl synthetase family protein, partial [Lacticaseibacillus rhamnosus]